MGFFGKKKADVIDLSEKYRKHHQRVANLKESISQKTPTSYGNTSTENSTFSFLGPLANSGSQQSDSSDSDDTEERKKRLAKRLMDMTNKIEDLSNKIYHLQQRVEVL